MSDHKTYMLRCIELGYQSLASGNAPVGSVVVQNDLIIGEGLELGKSKNDITYHAEIEAIRNALKQQNTQKLPGTTLYTTHEPCMMCSYVIRHYGIEKVVYSLPVQEIGGHSSEFGILKTDGVSNWAVIPEIISGFMKEDCLKLQEDFIESKSKR